MVCIASAPAGVKITKKDEVNKTVVTANHRGEGPSRGNVVVHLFIEETKELCEK